MDIQKYMGNLEKLESATRRPPAGRARAPTPAKLEYACTYYVLIKVRSNVPRDGADANKVRELASARRHVRRYACIDVIETSWRASAWHKVMTTCSDAILITRQTVSLQKELG